MKNVIEKFARMGARLKINQTDRPVRFRANNEFRIDVLRDKNGEFFDIQTQDIDMKVLDVQSADRHLLLRVGDENFPCGHDERQWFVAGVKTNAPTVKRAKEALKPLGVRSSERKNRVKGKNRIKRHNKGSIRQGEWFFVPEPDARFNANLILRKEPLMRGNRGGGKPHIAEELVRMGGTTVYVNPRHRNGLMEKEYKKLLAETPSAKRWRWQVMKRDPRVYVRGKIRHPDHKTVKLQGWYRVEVNDEIFSERVAFLD